MRQRYLALLFAGAIAGLAVHLGTTTKSTALSVLTMDIAEMQRQASKDLPITVIANLV